jgi:arylsulfatase A-like enzyme
MKRSINYTVITFVALLLAGSVAVGQAGNKKESYKLPNFVFILIDDMGYSDIGPFGSTKNKTPILDQMAREGIRLSNFYVSSTRCTPSRSALLTGCYADRVGMEGDVVFPVDKRGLNPQEITIAEILKSKGYTTGCFGKWHLGDQPEFLPLKQGFDEYSGIPYSNDMWTGKGNSKYPPLPFLKDNKVVAHISDGANQALLCDAITDAAVDFIKRHRSEPFFAYVPHAYVHNPRYTLNERAKKANGNIFRAQVEEVDGSVGRILGTLKDLGLAENTLVFFTSDNGGSVGTSMGPLRGGKGSPKYEGHMRVPALAWWPGRIPANRTSDEIGATIDILPTLAKIAGAEIPHDRIIDGCDIADILFGKTGARSPHNVLYYGTEGVRQGKWKLVRIGNRSELYDLETDLGEKSDLSNQNSEKLQELTALLEAHILDFKQNHRPAAFVSNPKPLITSAGRLPTLAGYMGLGNIEINEKPIINRKNKK